jgi:three-Cys-motif partner protein
MCQAAEKSAKGNYSAFFVNKDRAYHGQLVTNLQQAGYATTAHPILGDSTAILPRIPEIIRDSTVFLYLDPFGLKGCDFNLLEKFLARDQKLSTEIVLTMSMPAIHRLSCCRAVSRGNSSELITRYHETLTRVFGGDYWKEIMWTNLPSEQKEVQMIEAYKTRLKEYLPYVGSCPVRQEIGSRIKYFIVFVSRHPHAMVIMNDSMANAYYNRMHEVTYQGSLFEETKWQEMPESGDRAKQKLDQVILETVSTYPGETRGKIWERIIQDYFMVYLATEYRGMVKRLVAGNRLYCPTFANAKRLNDDCLLYPAQ